MIKNTCSIGFIRLLFQSVQKIYFSCLPLSLWFITLGSLYILNVYSGDLFSSPEEAALVDQLIETYNETHEGSDCWIGFSAERANDRCKSEAFVRFIFFLVGLLGLASYSAQKKKGRIQR